MNANLSPTVVGTTIPIQGSSYVFQMPPRNVGYWSVCNGRIRYYLPIKPRWLTRLMMKWLLELQWKDEI